MNEENSPAYLQGRLQALENVVITLALIVPQRAMTYLIADLKSERARVNENAEKDPAHKYWDMSRRSHHPIEQKPEVTLIAEGHDDLSAEIINALEEKLYAFQNNLSFPLLAASKEALKRDATD